MASNRGRYEENKGRARKGFGTLVATSMKPVHHCTRAYASDRIAGVEETRCDRPARCDEKSPLCRAGVVAGLSATSSICARSGHDLEKNPMPMSRGPGNCAKPIGRLTRRGRQTTSRVDGPRRADTARAAATHEDINEEGFSDKDRFAIDGWCGAARPARYRATARCEAEWSEAVDLVERCLKRCRARGSPNRRRSSVTPRRCCVKECSPRRGREPASQCRQGRRPGSMSAPRRHICQQRSPDIEQAMPWLLVGTNRVGRHRWSTRACASAT